MRRGSLLNSHHCNAFICMSPSQLYGFVLGKLPVDVGQFAAIVKILAPGAVHDLTAARIWASSLSWPPAAWSC
jgi:hypothetical protein